MRNLVLILCLLPLAATAEPRVSQSSAELPLSFAPLVRQAAPSVVNIYVRRVTTETRRTPFERPWAGMTGQPVNQDIAESFGLGIPEGVVITALHEGSPFARTGFEVGDVITAVEGVPVNAPAELVYRMSVAQEDDVLVDYIRQGRRGSVLVTLAPPPDDPPRADTELERDPVLPGLKLVRINPAVIAEFGLPLEATGVMVTDPGRFGARVGLRTGDVIQLINGTRVETPHVVQSALSRPGRFRLSVLRGNSRIVLSFGT